MNDEINTTLRRAEGRYLNDNERATIEAYTDGMLYRLQTMQAVERIENVLLDEVVEAVLRAHPEINEIHGPGGAPRVRRDQALVLRHATMAMVLDDPNFLYDKLAVWLRSILSALCAVEHVMTGHRAMVLACRTHLPEPDAVLVVPFLQIVIDEFAKGGGLRS
jgi:hypothetical protein